jgi:hypothetical protein
MSPFKNFLKNHLFKKSTRNALAGIIGTLFCNSIIFLETWIAEDPS